MEKTVKSKTETLSYSYDLFCNGKEDDEEEDDTNRKRVGRLLPSEDSNHR